MKNQIVFYLALIVPMLLFSQSREISGVVVDENNMPLPGANVIVSGLSQGGSTDFDGVFKFSVNENAKELVISYIGYKNKMVPLTDSNYYSIILEIDSNALDEVVVVGYGTMQRRDITGSVSKIKESSEVSGQYSSAGAILQGRTAGVQVISNSGAPGAPASVRIRGTNSLRGNNEPLYVVDGVILNSAGEDVLNATNDANETQATQNGLTGINMRDVESYEILKDASATAIYGSRGANGVVLITTKKGKQGKGVLNLYSSLNISQVNNKIDVLSGVNYAQYRNYDAILEGNNISYQIDGNDVFLIEDGIVSENPLRQVNWQNEVFRLANTVTAGGNFSGANEKSNYYFSGDISQVEGIIPNTFLNSGNVRINYGNKISDKLRINTRVAFYLSYGNMSQGASISGGQRSFIRQIVSYNPLVDGEIDNDEVGDTSPYTFINDYEEKIREKRLNASFDFTYELMKGFKYQLRAGINYRNKYRSRWYGPETFKGGLVNGDLSLSTLEKLSYTIDNLLIYNKRFNEKHKLNATLGVTYDGSDSFVTTYNVGEFPINTLKNRGPQYGELVLDPYSNADIKDAILSYLGRVNYTLNKKYIFNATFRIDNSSKFKDSNKTGYFPSFSFAWLANNESFLENFENLSSLKIRASWGKVGNQAINPYQTFSNYGPLQYSDANNSTILGVAALNIENKNLKWETTSQLNFGADVGFYDNRYSFSVDAYKKETTDLLISLPTPTSTGFSNFLTNQGSIENIGLDFSFDATPIQKEDFSISFGGNISFNRSKVIDLGELPEREIYIDGIKVNKSYYLGNNVSTGNNFKSPANAFIEGEPIGVFWGYKTNGIYSDQTQADNGPTFQGNANSPGDIAFVDVNGDGNINDADKTNIGNPNPDFTFGFNTSLTYKNFDFSMLFTGSKGNDIMNGNLLVENVAEGTAKNIRPDAYLDSWSEENPLGAFPRVGSASNIPSDRIIEDGSYLRLNNVTIGYTYNFEENLVSSFKIYLSANNLLTFTNYSGFDPELTSFLYEGTIMGVDWAGTPNISSVLVGVNIKL